MIFLFLALLDQILKFLALRGKVAVINQGIAWGLFSSFKNFSFLILICIFAFCYLIFTISKRHSKIILPLKFILVGGLSNLLDRIFYGGVVDYLHLPYIPSFNLADLAITTGFLLILGQLFFQKIPSK